MGLTVHYSGGKAESEKKIYELFSYLEGIAKKMKWENWDTKDDKDWRGEKMDFRSFSMNIDEGCETLEIGFNFDTLELHQAFCKTQYSKNFMQTHHIICVLLDTIKKNYVKDMEVHDEGGYYGVWDKKALGEEIKEWDAMIGKFADRLKTAFGDNPNIKILKQPKIQNGEIKKD